MISSGNASSGNVILDPQIDELYQKLKLSKKVSLRWIIMKMVENNTKIVIENSGGIDESYQKADDKAKKKKTHEEFVKLLPRNECRFAVVDCDKNIYYVLWTPDEASVKDKMVYSYSSSKLSLGAKLAGGHEGSSIEAHEFSDLDKLAQ